MRIHKLDISQIEYEYKNYSDSLLASIKRIGLSFPLKVKYINNQYYCIDGHKRLSALNDFDDIDLLNKRRRVNVVIVNNGDLRSNDCWKGRNTH